tara:strand:+ start:77 stop:844 length:768 start_codon:yes stop_codon:yes gene_type:complete
MDFPVEMVDINHPKATQHTMSEYTNAMTTLSDLLEVQDLQDPAKTMLGNVIRERESLKAQLAETDKIADSYKSRFLALKEENQKLKDELFIKTEMKEKMTEENAELYGGMAAASMRVIELDMKLKYKSDAIEKLEGQLDWSKSHLKKSLEMLSVMKESFKKVKAAALTREEETEKRVEELKDLVRILEEQNKMKQDSIQQKDARIMDLSGETITKDNRIAELDAKVAELESKTRFWHVERSLMEGLSESDSDATE